MELRALAAKKVINGTLVIWTMDPKLSYLCKLTQEYRIEYQDNLIILSADASK